MSSLKYALAVAGASSRRREVVHTTICDGDCDGGSGEAEREAEVVELRSSKGPHSRKDGNPLGWLALGRSARGRGFGCQATFILIVSKSPLPRDAGGFNEPNKTVNKFYLHGTNSVLEGLRHCCPPDHISHIT